MSNNVDDPTVLKVKGEKSFTTDQERKNYVKMLASAIIKVVEKYGHAKLRTVGASSGNNAWKAIIVAKNEVIKNGTNLVVDPYFDSVVFDKEERTAIVLKVEPKEGVKNA